MTDSRSGAPPRLSAPQRLVTTIATLASFVTSLDMSVTNVALPRISEELGGGLSTQQWVVDAYLVTLSALMLLAGSIADAYGRVFIMRIGLIGFGIASIAVGLAVNPEMMILARALQGAAGAFLLPSSLALITSRIAGAAQGRAIGAWTAVTTGAMIVGPLLGGVFTDYLSWRLVFLINVLPIGATLWMLTKLPDTDDRRRGVRIDWLGGAAAAIGLGLAVWALIEEPAHGWASPAIWLPLGAGVALLLGFLWWQTRVTSPILPLALFRVRNFWTGNLATLFIYAALSLNGFVIGVYLQNPNGPALTATLAGLASLPITILMVLLSSKVGALAGRYGPRLFMTVGPLLLGCGALLLLLVGDQFSYWGQVLPSMVVMGLGLSIMVAPLTAAILGAIGPERSGIASAVNNAISRVAGLIVIALLATIVGGRLDLGGFHSAAIVTGVLFFAGAIVSFLGIRNPAPEGAA
ncbi:MFS transporter [Leucobacter chromiiresistens]|uniref:Drug resistance transporter, EmrB/QacA subfamily n=1 Tax=Leucobacter chromiiresistens TaxID=1079994 RepID=A0A1H0YZE3_9MICO|nr:MFS transporter [Leucobacter chromiiresistens]SDQ20484.1 drug resistance transporter, EmrB/QacA subfamily [Leucobacter chromiiresistens]